MVKATTTRKEERIRLGILATHPIQYYVPWYRRLAEHPQIELEVFYAHRQTQQGQAEAGFGVSFDWDVPLEEGYNFRYLKNVSGRPGLNSFWGCDTPEIGRIIRNSHYHAFLVQGWWVKSFWQAMWACWSTGTPVLVRGDSQLRKARWAFKNIAKYPLYRWFIPKFDGYLVVGKRNREYYLYYGAKPERLHFVPHAVDNEYFYTRAQQLIASRSELRCRWGIPEGKSIFLYAGKFTNEKHPLDFILALDKSSGEGANVHGLLAGDGPLRAKMLDVISKRKVGCTFLGFLNQSKMGEVYALSDAVILPGRETWGLVVNEAMACGLPAIVSDAAGCAPDLVIPGQTGEVFPIGDVQALASLLASMAAWPVRTNKMGANARNHITNFSMQKAADSTASAVIAVVESKKASFLHRRASMT